jgi:hypothetical protein
METLLYLDHGLELADLMRRKLGEIERLLPPDNKTTALTNSIEQTFFLIKSNNLYVKTCFAYFDYRNKPTETNKYHLSRMRGQLRETIQRFREVPGFVYRLDGMTQLLHNVDQVLDDLSGAEQVLRNAPNDAAIRELIAAQQSQYAHVLEKYAGEAKKIVAWQGRVDGRDLVKVQGDHLEIEHLRYDPIADSAYEFENPLPAAPVTVIPVDIESRSFHPFVLEQPSAENHFTATIYLSDFPLHGYSRWRFELYYLPHSPRELGLSVPWQ